VVGGALAGAREEAEGERQQRVAGEDRERLAVDLVAGRPAAAQVVVVHRGQVVVDEAVGVDALDGGRGESGVGVAAAVVRAEARTSVGRRRLPPPSSA
jgi:hypothetical protein